MELNKNHREALLNELSKAKEDKELQEKCLDKHKLTHMSCYYEISIFLADEKIKLIEKSLVENEIDF